MEEVSKLRVSLSNQTEVQSISPYLDISPETWNV